MRRRILLSKTSEDGGCGDIEYEWVDLGLSGACENLLWCKQNVGAESESDYGNYYKYGYGSSVFETGQANYTGSENPLALSADTAAMVIGGGSRIPTRRECQALIDQTSSAWTIVNGVYGVSLRNKNDSTKKIFLPANGSMSSAGVVGEAGESGFYLTSTPRDSTYVYRFSFRTSGNTKIFVIDTNLRSYGRCVRAVKDKISYSYVDLGLPSGVKWATMNVGASSETDYGVYFQWGSIVPYKNTDQFDTGTIELSECTDTARQWMGEPWRVPTYDECRELINNTTYEWTTIDNVTVAKVTGPNGNYIYLPASGYYTNGSNSSVGTYGLYMVATPGASSTCYALCIGSDLFGTDGWFKNIGYSVRGVRDAQKIGNYEYVDLGLPSGKLWATMNVGATSVNDYGNYYQWGKGSATYQTTSGQSTYNVTGDPVALSADTAYQVMGGGWRMPTKDEYFELLTSTTQTLDAVINGIKGVKFTASNGAYVFLPYGGYYSPRAKTPSSVGTELMYWTSTVDERNRNSNSYYVLTDGEIQMWTHSRDYGMSVRPIHDRLT